MRTQLYIYGYSDYARLCRHYFCLRGEDSFKAYLVDKLFLPQFSNASDPVHSIDDSEIRHSLKENFLFVAIGYSKMRQRKNCFVKGRRLGSTLRNYISPDASVDPTVTLGTNNIVMPGVVIEPFATLGDNNIVWSNVTICHDSTIGSHNFLAAASVLGGGSRIGDLCFLGFSSVVLQGIKVSDETLLGANSILTENSAACEKRIGQPAKIVDHHHDTGISI